MSIFDKAKSGLALTDILIIDSHNHIGCWKEFHIPENTAEGMLVSMDTLGIDKAFITAHASIGPDYVYGNDIVIDALRRFPDRFLGYATVNPSYEEDMKHELERCFRAPGMRGIKLHPSSHGSSVDNKKYRIAYEAANERGCPILIHTWGRADVAAIDRMSAQYKKAQFIIAHSGAYIEAMSDAIDIVNSRDNAYLDLAISLPYEGNVEWLVREAGSKKILFGTDMPFFDPRHTFGRVVMADITDDEKKDILGLNMQRLLDRCL